MSLSQGKGKQPETLEIEDDDARLQRIQRALEQLNTVAPSQAAGLESLLNAPGASQPESGSGVPLEELLARVQEFLPQLQASNAQLAEMAARDPRSVDIENVEGDEEVIEMNLGLGVFEDRTGKQGSDSSSDEDSSDAESEEKSSDSDSDDMDTTDDSSSSDVRSAARPQGLGRQVAPLPRRAIISRPTKPLPRRARPEIVVLSATITEDN
ncbi:hypothetical protein B0H15DRAFT_513935 [Mycena belliarum]|uniref:Uncharacterized protein n=1 Tax=Mycena belliarum TaxID=1033014 RepID=A0AAD6UDX9_9AGAR|nr:hypothetical protein B0H15DRAFT_513935 [Mycena belliae]